MGNYSTQLFAPPSFWEGMGRLFDFGGTLTEFNTSPSPELADFYPLQSDWKAVGADMNSAITKARDVGKIQQEKK